MIPSAPPYDADPLGDIELDFIESAFIPAPGTALRMGPGLAVLASFLRRG